MAKKPNLPAPPVQYSLDLGIEVEKSVGGVEMGVLENGMPYLTQTGLAAMSGAARSTIFEITQEWAEGLDSPINPKTRLGFFQNYLFKNGYAEPQLYVEITKNGSPHYAYPDIVCMAVSEVSAGQGRIQQEAWPFCRPLHQASRKPALQRLAGQGCRNGNSGSATGARQLWLVRSGGQIPSR
jgi:hypothetical protein